MGFVDVKLSDVTLDKPAAVPAGKGYVFQLVPGAVYRINKYNDVEELNVSASIAEGEYAGRRVFWNYPDPTAVAKNSGKIMSWSAQALKKLEIALGEDSLPGEDPAMYLNRVAMNSHARFTADLDPEERKNAETGEREPFIRTGETEPRAVFNIFSVGPSA